MKQRNWETLDPHLIYDEMTEAADRYAETQYISDLAEKVAEKAFDDAFLALRDEPGSIDRKKAQARASQQHQDALSAAIAAKREALKAKLSWQALVTKLEFVRTLETSLRAQAQYISHQRG